MQRKSLTIAHAEKARNEDQELKWPNKTRRREGKDNIENQSQCKSVDELGSKRAPFVFFQMKRQTTRK